MDYNSSENLKEIMYGETPEKCEEAWEIFKKYHTNWVIFDDIYYLYWIVTDGGTDHIKNEAWDMYHTGFNINRIQDCESNGGTVYIRKCAARELQKRGKHIVRDGFVYNLLKFVDTFGKIDGTKSDLFYFNTACDYLRMIEIPYKFLGSPIGKKIEKLRRECQGLKEGSTVVSLKEVYQEVEWLSVLIDEEVFGIETDLCKTK